MEEVVVGRRKRQQRHQSERARERMKQRERVEARKRDYTDKKKRSKRHASRALSPVPFLLNTTRLSHCRSVLELEQEKVARQEELTKTTEKLSALQEELTALKATEKELHTQFVALKEEVSWFRSWDRQVAKRCTQC